MKTPKTLVAPAPDTRKELFVEVNSSCIRENRAQEQFGSWNADYTSHLGKVARSTDQLHRWSFSAFKVPDVVYEADSVYIVTVTYSSGDSFGSSSGHMDVAFITEDLKEAQLVEKAIVEQDTIERESRWSSSKKDPSRPYDELWRNHEKSVQKGYAPWNGYFESIESVDLHVKLVSL